MDVRNPFAPLTEGMKEGAGPSSAATAEGLKKKRKSRSGRKHKKSRRKSFMALVEDDADNMGNEEGPHVRNGFYRHGANLSNTSIDSEALLDHRTHPYTPRTRRLSTLATPFKTDHGSQVRVRAKHNGHSDYDEENDGHTGSDEGAPLLSRSMKLAGSPGPRNGYGSGEVRVKLDRRGSSRSSNLRSSERYNVNNPPSVPASPQMGPTDRLDINFGDEMMRQEMDEGLRRVENLLESQDDPLRGSPSLQRRHTIGFQAEDDVCYPQEGMSELADDDLHLPQGRRTSRREGRRRRDRWPDLAVLEEWSRFEKEMTTSRNAERRIKKITEPQLINGRLRPVHKGWYRTEEDAPYRFTYFNEEFQSTIHSQTISELVQPETSFRDLFIPEPPILSDSEEWSDEETSLAPPHTSALPRHPQTMNSKLPTRQPSLAATNRSSERTERGIDGTLSPRQMPIDAGATSRQHSGEGTPARADSPLLSQLKSISPRRDKPIRYGERPTWWLDVLSPTEAEMKVIQKAFGIHPLTSEDIMLQEQREKVELFRHYYFVNYRSFDQDEESETHLDPVNVYVVVFREGVISFHFSQTPHPANVRRRMRQLKDYITLSPDWISYAIIDDITDTFGPLIQKIEEEVDDIDDVILKLHRSHDPTAKEKSRKGDGDEKGSVNGDNSAPNCDADMLERIGNCRKKVMELYRLLGNKADVIKGFAKRCNEHWDVAPRSEIGLYLGDIQDHILTMTGNLSHYEKILSRSHANYLAQINIRMNERQEETADTLGKLTVLGTIVLPMNIITGLWGMNVWVPGQEHEGNLTWFWCISAGLVVFAMACFLIAKRVYKIV
ncbi:hypothetical protein BX600DRAFT_507615 [Xylariales sp. PMI_506]|nr:hypothetical protein BX600DRAFT_507615 [Xylariales sp. PMI_506]